MRASAFIAIAAVLCSLSIDCTKSDTNARKEWGLEPRLSVEVDWSLADQKDCRPIRTEQQAVSVAIAQTACSDAGIAALKNFADRDATAMSDLAAAYYIRAQRQNRPADYLNAFDAAFHAANAIPPPAAARFNLALCEEALGLTTDAMAIFGALQNEDATSRERLRRLQQQRDEQWSPRWLHAALRAGDRRAVERIVRLHPSSALLYMEDELLPDQLPYARTLADAWTRITGNHYARDEIAAVASANPAQRAALKAGYAALRDGRITTFPGINTYYAAAVPQLQLGGSPAALYARGGLAFSKKDVAAIEAMRRETHARGYANIEAWLTSGAGYQLWQQDRHLEALAHYDEASAMYRRLHDPEGLTATATRRFGILRVLGQSERGWSDALATVRNRRFLGQPRDRHLVLGESAASALALGHPQAALQYANEGVRFVQQMSVETPPDRLVAIAYLQTNIAIALRRRADYQLLTGHNHAALQDLAEARRLSARDPSPQYRVALDARIAEVEAQAYAPRDPRRAVAAFTSAIDLSRGLEYSAFRASLYAQRAAAERRAGLERESEADLRAALDLLHQEEARVLEKRVRGGEDILWSDYFSRFEDAYHVLIRELIETNRQAEAFVYADRSRAFEPLNLALKLAPPPNAPSQLDLPALQRTLPPGTFLIEYTVMEDRTYAWVISRDAWRLLPLGVRQRDVERWNNALSRAVPTRDTTTLDATLFAAYDALLAEPLRAVAQMTNGAARLVFVPDGPMYGLPFSALRNPETRRYVIEDAPVETAGSAALYTLSVTRDAQLPRDTSALLIGNPDGAHLPGAEAEVHAIAQSYAGAVVRTGADATADAFITGVRDDAIVHVAAHAIVDAQTPSSSSLHFAQTPGQPGALDAAHLLSQLKPGRARLVVLAACSSAAGMPVGAEGVGPLVRPLIANGVPAVVGTLWNIGDATVEPLLVSFHQHYRMGDDAAVAMQKAQIELLRKNNSSGLQSVLVWAPFQVIGHGSSPFAPAR
ncbi:MAG: CHAT domain-containing protein [Acidobacteria bacterium]|nr:CHAT domain-containing protein [Acidobacteriota bacterium]MBV9476283.1 CHAT domain-containing protein [Acidobacteriota bacterium]